VPCITVVPHMLTEASPRLSSVLFPVFLFSRRLSPLFNPRFPFVEDPVVAYWFGASGVLFFSRFFPHPTYSPPIAPHSLFHLPVVTFCVPLPPPPPGGFKKGSLPRPFPSTGLLFLRKAGPFSF